jgi:hypothetical protein
VTFFFDCPGHAASNPSFPIHCPSTSLVADVTDAIHRGWLTWHAFPLNSEPESYDAELFVAGVDLCQQLADRFSMPKPTVLSQRDVPGLTRAVIPLLVERGVRALSVGANTYSASASVPRIYRWLEPASEATVIALQHPGGYGDGSTVVVNGSKHALHLLFNGDNAGPHETSTVISRHAKLAAQYPNARIRGASWDSFIDAITMDGSAAALPMEDKEEGDTWIYVSSVAGSLMPLSLCHCWRVRSLNPEKKGLIARAPVHRDCNRICTRLQQPGRLCGHVEAASANWATRYVAGMQLLHFATLQGLPSSWASTRGASIGATWIR